MSATHLGRVGGQLAEQLAYLTSPSRIDAEIAHHEAAIAGGDTSQETVTLLRDWQAIKTTQQRLLCGVAAQQNSAPTSDK